MIKMFYIFILLCCMAPFNGHTEEFLQTKNSFLLVKAVKLGRSSVESNNILSSTAGKNELLKKCDPNCSNCNKVTGECLACDSGRFLNENLCLVCPKMPVAVTAEHLNAWRDIIKTAKNALFARQDIIQLPERQIAVLVLRGLFHQSVPPDVQIVRQELFHQDRQPLV